MAAVSGDEDSRTDEAGDHGVAGVYAVAAELCRHLPDFVFRRNIEGYLRSKKPRLRKLIEGAFADLWIR